jgi:serine/threonine-protein kinase
MSSFDSDTSVERSYENGWRLRPGGEPSTPVAVDDVPTSRMLRLWLVGNRYELYDQISQGGMGRVYRAVHRDLGRPFALKLLLENQRQRQESRERFFVEARLASSLCHPNIVSVTDYGLDEQHGCYLVMEMLEGGTVRARMREAPVSPRLCFDIVDQLTGAVRYMHGRGIIHGDIKPENLFLARIEGEPRRKNVVKLLDFGLSFRSGGAPEHKLGGTPPYLPPERLQGAPPSPSSDVYSLGAVMWELLTGKPLYTGALPEVIDKTISGPPPTAPSQLSRFRLDPGIDALVLRALERDPARRHPTAEAFHFELRTVMSMTGLKVRKPKRVGPLPPEARQAVDAALEAVGRGDLDSVRRILLEAKQSLESFMSLDALGEDDSGVLGPAEPRERGEGIEDP